jgi:hypothetical protein
MKWRWYCGHLVIYVSHHFVVTVWVIPTNYGFFFNKRHFIVLLIAQKLNQHLSEHN